MKRLVIVTRKNAGRNEDPTYAIIDSQSVKTVGAGEERGFDGEKTKGRKRHIVTDTMGNILGVIIYAANVHDTVSGIYAAIEAFQIWPTIEKFRADKGYRGTFVHEVNGRLLMSVEIPEKSNPHEWEILPWRWIVERTIGCFNHSRRLSKDYETTTSSSLAMVQISHFHTL